MQTCLRCRHGRFCGRHQFSGLGRLRTLPNEPALSASAIVAKVTAIHRAMLALERRAVENRVLLPSRVQTRVGELLHRWRGRSILHPSGNSVTDRSLRQTSTIILAGFVNDYNSIERMVDSAIGPAGPSADPDVEPEPEPASGDKTPLTTRKPGGMTTGQVAVAGVAIVGLGVALFVATRR